ncbi:Nicotinate phosphoribosyltransferase (NAPRTase) family protein [Saccharomyces cerevisiae]|nr:Nicotinate phosphoribosyltransferase (NAPRTase) family protein [Saccharomyces cerevisiae]
MSEPVIKSLLDTDMYKITMHAAVFTNFPDVTVTYKYTNRSSQLTFNKEAINWLKEQFSYLGNLRADFLHFRRIEGKPTHYKLKILVSGSWKDTILYETPLLSLISEAYFKFVDTDWDYENQLEQAEKKAETLFDNGIRFSEFGTRRRRSLKAQDLIMQGIMKAVNGNPDRNKSLF